MRNRFRSPLLIAALAAGTATATCQAELPYKIAYDEAPIPGARLVRGPRRTTQEENLAPDKSLAQRVWTFRSRPSRLTKFKGSQFDEAPAGGSALVPSEPLPPPDLPNPPSSRKNW